MMREFKQNLMTSGVRDTSLYSAIDNLKYIDKTGFILISGDPVSVDKASRIPEEI